MYVYLHALTNLIAHFIYKTLSEDVEPVLLDVGLDALNMSDAEACVLGDFGLCFTFDDFQLNAEEPTVGLFVGEGFFKA
jgi:hypothetical protein